MTASEYRRACGKSSHKELLRIFGDGYANDPQVDHYSTCMNQTLHRCDGTLLTDMTSKSVKTNFNLSVPLKYTQVVCVNQK